jgi:hypothetical protein
MQNIKSIITAVRKFDKAITNTVVEESKLVAERVWNTFGDECSEETAANVADAIAADAPWKGTGSEAVRKSEWKAFVYAVQFYLPEALDHWKTKHKDVTLTRVALFGLARRLPKGDDYKAIVDAYVADLKSKKSGSSNKKVHPATAIKNSIASIFRVQTNAKNVIAFRKELAELCNKHGIEINA